MDDNVLQVDYESRIKKVLQKLLEPKFKLKNDVYLNSLLSYFSGKTENKFYDSGAFTETFLSWIVTATTQWEEKSPPSPDIFVFALNLTSFISKQEFAFVRLNGQEVYERLIKLIQVQKSSTTAGVKLAYINLLSAFLEHKSGKQWIIATNYWNEIMDLTLKGGTHYTSKEGYKFLAKLLRATIKLSEWFCINVIQMILEPLKSFDATQSNILCHTGNTLIIQDQAIYQSLCGTITLTTELLEIFLENVGSKDARGVINIFVEKFQLETLINNVLMVAQNEDFVYDLNRVLCILALYEILVKLEGMKAVSYEQAFPHIKKLFKILMDNIHKGYVANVLKLCYMTQIYYKSISSYMPVCTKQEKDILLFENQIMLMQITPMFLVSHKILGRVTSEEGIEDVTWIRDMYISKMLRVTCSDTLHLVFVWKHKLLDLPNFNMTTLALMYILNSKKFFRRKTGALVFQVLIHMLKDVLHAVRGNECLAEPLTRETNMLALLLEGIVTYIQEFNLSSKDWAESVELVCVTSVTCDFLDAAQWTPKSKLLNCRIIPVETWLPRYFKHFCTLEDLVGLMKQDSKKMETLAAGGVLECLMNNIQAYLNKYDFTWTETVETICMMDIMMDFFDLQEWESKLVTYEVWIFNTSWDLLMEGLSDDIREVFVNRFWEKMRVACRTMKTLWNWRDAVSERADLPDVVVLSLTYLSRLQHYMSKDTATMLFECFVNTLKDLITAVMEDPKKIHILAHNAEIIESVMDNILIYVENFNFSWPEVIGTISLMDVTVDYIQMDVWGYKIRISLPRPTRSHEL